MSLELFKKVSIVMKNLALIYFIGNEFKQIKRLSLIGIFRKLKRLFTFKISPINIDTLDVDNSFKIYAVKIPYTLDDLKNAGKYTRNKINKCILKVCTENSINKCIIPADLTLYLDKCEKSCFTGEILYTAIATNILETLCAQKGVSVRKADIAAIYGDKEALPYILVKLLSPIVKFVTLVTKNKELIEQKIEEICDETGLSVRITSDVSGVLNNSDFVINYGNITSNSIKKVIDSNAIVINYGQIDENLLGRGNTVINGIEIGLADKFANSFDNEIFKYYSPNEFAEIILLNKFDLGINNLDDLADYIIVDRLIKCFLDEGFYVKGLL